MTIKSRTKRPRPTSRPPARNSRRPVNRKSTPNRQPTLWDQAARWYDNLVGIHGTDFHKTIIMPGVLRMLAVKKGSRVLDVACGQGVFSRYLSSRGMKAEGLDSSEELLHFARDRSHDAIKFHVADAGDPKALTDSRYDAADCILALQNMEHLEPVFANVARWLKPGGHFVMVVTHPCFRIPRQTHWGWDEEKKMEYRRIDHYTSELQIPILTPPMAQSKIYTQTWHRPLEKYVQALTGAGLVIDGLEEWISNKESRPGKRAKAENRARREIPLFLAIRARLIE